jgi:hypothetical protein
LKKGLKSGEAVKSQCDFYKTVAKQTYGKKIISEKKQKPEGSVRYGLMKGVFA